MIDEVRIRFLKNEGKYKKGQLAAFPARFATIYVARGVAEIVLQEQTIPEDKTDIFSRMKRKIITK